MPDLDSAIASAVAATPGSEASTGGGDTSTALIAPETSTPDASDAAPAAQEGAGGDETVTAPVSAQTDGAVPAAPVADPVPAPIDPANDTLETLAEEMAGKRDNRIPYSRVKRIADNQAKREVAKALEPYNSPDFQNTRQAMKVADENPEQFLSALAQADPRYAALLAGSKLTGATAAPAARAAAPQSTEEVAPDIQLSDGTLGYSAEASRKLLDSRLAQQQQALLQEFETRLQEFKPIKDRYEEAQQRDSAATEVASKIGKAQSWPGFEENKAAMGAWVAEATKRRERVTLHDAYIAVVVPKLQAAGATAANEARAKVIADMKKQQAASTGVTPGAAAKTDSVAAASQDPDERLTGSIKAALAGLKR